MSLLATMLPRVSVEILTSEIWQRIAFYTIASQEKFLGPPSDLSSLALVSREINNKIYRQNSSHLLARVFCFKFNVAAIFRRASLRWHTTRCLASELVKRFQALKRIKAKEFNPDDIWTCYLMMSENDGKNERQLIDYAGLPEYLQSVIIYRSRPHADLSWYQNSTLDSLIVWIMWMTASRDQIAGENPNFRQLVMGILQSFIVAAHKHSSLHGPDHYFNLPLCSGVESFPSLDFGPPPVSEILHYSHSLKIAAPAATSAGLLNYVLRIESLQTESTFPQNASRFPRDRADAISQGLIGPTLEDIIDFHYKNRIPTMNRCPVSIDTRFIEDLKEESFSENGSKRYDEDWSRLVGCQDLHIGDTPLRGIVFKLGSMTGSWAGRFLAAFYEPMTSILAGSQQNPLSVSIVPKPLHWELQEHHCLIPNEPLRAGLDEDSYDDILNAWLPRGLVFTHLDDGLEVHDQTTGKTARYETFVPRNQAPYTKLVCDKLQKVGISSESESSDEEIADSRSLPGSEDPDFNSYYDDDDRFSDTVCHLSSGVCDILITGKTGSRYGDAWGHFTIQGRVRAWDGLVVLLRFPTDPAQAHLGKWIFKGYLHDQNFVGRWRETSTPNNTIGYGGGFVVYKTDNLGDGEITV